YTGAYTKNAYNQAYGSNIDYDSSETFQEIQQGRNEKLVQIYQKELLEIYHTNDFYDMASDYGNGRGGGFSPSGVMNI
nr:hypothetical protein [Enterococcus faecalis]